jgi:uncharacterized membrane protein
VIVKHAAIAISLLIAAPAAVGQSTFAGIGLLPSGESSSLAAVSAVGSTAVGRALRGGQELPIRWTLAGGLQAIGNSTDRATGRAIAVSADGSFIVGKASSALITTTEAFRWSTSEGFQYLVGVNGFATGVSSDGQTVVGNGGSFGWRWRQGAVNIVVGTWSGSFGDCAGVSGDGRSVVGSYTTTSPQLRPQRPFLWTTSAGMVDLGSISESASSSGLARAISEDGLVVVGQTDAGNGTSHATRWVLGSPPQDLVPGSLDWSIARAVSNQGAVVVGQLGGRAMYWSEAAGARLLRDILLRNYGLDVRGWCFLSANGVSADGRTIVGDAVSPDGVQQGFVARLDAPLDPPLCPADWNLDGFVDAVDFDEFVGPWLAASPLADFDGDCFTDAIDYDGFVSAWLTGC